MSKTVRIFLLLLLVMVSVSFSINLWTAGDLATEESSSQNTTQPTSLVDREIEEVYAPYQFLRHGPTDSFLVHPSHVENLYQLLIDNFSAYEVSAIQSLSRDDYLRRLQSANGTAFEFVFNDLLPLGLFEEIIEEMPPNLTDESLNRMAVIQGRDLEVLFYDSINENVFELNIETLDTNPLKSYLENDEIDESKVLINQVKENYIYLPTNPKNLQYRDFVVERLSHSFYVNTFFPETSGVDVRSDDSHTRYIDLTTELRVSDEYNTVTYTRQRQNQYGMSVVDQFVESYNYVVQLENWKEAVRFKDYQPEENLVTYQRFIEGFPVFSLDQLESTVEVSVVENGLRHMQIPMRIIQTPITIEDRSQVDLLPAEEVVNEIRQSPNLRMKEIDDIQIGLSWIESDESAQVVHFNPDWFVSYEGEWHRLEVLMAEERGER